MKRRIAIFYISLEDGSDRWPVNCAAFNGALPTVVFIRTEQVEAKDLSDALDKAKPRADESVMNTHYIS